MKLLFGLPQGSELIFFVLPFLIISIIIGAIIYFIFKAGQWSGEAKAFRYLNKEEKEKQN